MTRDHDANRLLERAAGSKVSATVTLDGCANPACIACAFLGGRGYLSEEEVEVEDESNSLSRGANAGQPSAKL